MARASTNLIHRFESKLESMLEAQNARLDAQTEALNSKLCFIQWIIEGLGLIAATGAVIAVIQALP